MLFIKIFWLLNLNKNEVKILIGIKNVFNGIKNFLVLVDLKENRFNINEMWVEIGGLMEVWELDFLDIGFNELFILVFVKNMFIWKLDFNNNNIGLFFLVSFLDGL